MVVVKAKAMEGQGRWGRGAAVLHYERVFRFLGLDSDYSGMEGEGAATAAHQRQNITK